MWEGRENDEKHGYHSFTYIIYIYSIGSTCTIRDTVIECDLFFLHYYWLTISFYSIVLILRLLFYPSLITYMASSSGGSSSGTERKLTRM